MDTLNQHRKWTAALVKHNGENRIAVYFEKDAELIARIKKLADCKWSQTLKAWHVPDHEENRKRFKLTLKVELSEEHLIKMEEFTRWLKSKRYSESTIKTYTEAIKVFLMYYVHKKVDEINNDDLIRFNNEYILKKNLSASYQNQVINGVKLFFQTIENTKLKVDLVHRPRREHKLPNVLSKEEVKEILNALVNIKHRTMLSLIYSCGLRRSELIHMKPADIDSKRKIIHIRQSKGKKDRIVPLSDKILLMLREYYTAYKPKEWLFEGQIAKEQYSEKSLTNVLKQALAKTKINKPVTLHWLRHSYATHILEAGTDLRYIQELLGHSSSRTTEIYTHVSTKNIQKIKSPFDDLDI